MMMFVPNFLIVFVSLHTKNHNHSLSLCAGFSMMGWTKAISLFYSCRLILKFDELGQEIAQIALPAALALTADPIASLVDTAFIGQIGTSFLLCSFQVCVWYSYSV